MNIRALKIVLKITYLSTQLKSSASLRGIFLQYVESTAVILEIPMTRNSYICTKATFHYSR